MYTRLTLHPNQHGARQLFAQYGERLVRVRYRYDKQRQKRFKTVELIIEESDWHPLAPQRVVDGIVQIRVAPSEVEVRRQVKGAGGRWDPQRCVWELRYDRVVASGLEGRIVKEESIYI